MTTGKITEYGFQFGPVLVERACSDEKKGWVMLTLTTKKHSPQRIQIYVTKTGKVRIHSTAGEWLPPKKVESSRHSTVRST